MPKYVKMHSHNQIKKSGKSDYLGTKAMGIAGQRLALIGQLAAIRPMWEGVHALESPPSDPHPSIIGTL